MGDHPSLEELTALSRGNLASDRSRAVMRHLLEGCESCLSMVSTPLSVIMGVDQSPGPLLAEDADRGEAIQRAFDAALKHARHLSQQRLLADQALTQLEKGGLESAEKVARKIKGLALYQALLARSWALRHEDPGLMIQFAQLATMAAEKLSVRRYGLQRLADFQCRAWAELGNAFRTADKLDLAESAFTRAVELYTRGTGDQFLGIRLLELQASLAADQRRFALASKILSLVCRYHRRHSDPHLAGRVLISRGLYTGYSGDVEEAIRLLRQGLSMIDEDREPLLAFAAVHNQLLFLVDGGSLRDARKILFQNRRRLLNSGGKINQVKILWLEGRIDAGLGRLVRAEQIFQQVRRGLADAGLAYQGSIASLDLAAVLLSQGRAAEAQAVVLEATQTFAALGIAREAMGAVLLLRQTVELRAATASFVAEVAAFLRQVEFDPSARFEPS